MKIKVKTSVNEYHNIHYYTMFNVEYDKPEIEDTFSVMTGTRISDVFPVYPDLSTTNIYTPDFEHFFELWGAKVLTDEEDESQFEYRYIAVPVDPIETEESPQKDVNGLEKDVFESMVQDFLSDRGEDDLILCDEPELDEDGSWMQCVKGVDDNRIYTLHYTSDMDIYLAY